MYLIIVDKTSGERITSYVVGVHGNTIDEVKEVAKKDGYTKGKVILLEADSEVQGHFLDGKIYKDGKFIEKPPIILTDEEKQAQEAEQVAKGYEEKFKALDNDIIHAAVVDQDEEYANELRASRAELEQEFLSARGEL